MGNHRQDETAGENGVEARNIARIFTHPDHESPLRSSHDMAILEVILTGFARINTYIE